MEPIEPRAILSLIRRLVEYPEARICRHYVASCLVEILEEYGARPTPEFKALAQALSDSSLGDEKALEMLFEIESQLR